MSVLFTDHFEVQTTPKRVFRHFFLWTVFAHLIALNYVASVRYNHRDFTKAQWLGALAGFIPSSLLILFIWLCIEEDFMVLLTAGIISYVVGFIIYAIVARVRERGEEHYSFRTYRSWGNGRF